MDGQTHHTHASGGTAVLADRAAAVLRTLALDEQLKSVVSQDGALGPVARRVARRYVAGETLDEAVSFVRAINAAGHRATADYMGESCRDPVMADAETDVMVALSDRLAHEGLDCSVSLDLSHIGLIIDDAQCLRNATKLAEATQRNGQEMIISMEGADRTDAILRHHGLLCERFTHVGVTVQARLHRTEQDLATLLARPGRIRLVKGAYPFADDVAHARGSAELHRAYLKHAETLLKSGHLCSIASHDRAIHQEIQAAFLPSAPASTGTCPAYEFETLMGIGRELLDGLRQAGLPTREYVVFGHEWWLYTCNRLAEDPTRVWQALIDAVEADRPSA
jgi:proline dehydrogenase